MKSFYLRGIFDPLWIAIAFIPPIVAVICPRQFTLISSVDEQPIASAAITLQ
jgi:hypothetical protein